MLRKWKFETLKPRFGLSASSERQVWRSDGRDFMYECCG